MREKNAGNLINFIFLILLINIFLISAQEERFNAPQGTDIDVKETCEASGFPCDSTFECNITIENSNRTIVALNKPMMKNETLWNYTLTSSNTQTLGLYKSDACCHNATDSSCDTFYFKVTKSGEEIDVSTTMIYLIVLIGSIFIFIFALYGTFKIPYKNSRSDEGFITNISNLKYAKIFLGFMTYAILIWIANILVEITNYFLVLSAAYTFFSLVFNFLIAFSFPAVAIGVVVILINLFKDAKIKKMLERGVRILS